MKVITIPPPVTVPMPKLVERLMEFVDMPRTILQFLQECLDAFDTFSKGHVNALLYQKLTKILNDSDPAKGELWFEARVKKSTLTATKHGWFLGLMTNTALTAIVPITAAGALADVGCVGFFQKETSAGTVCTSYKASGVTAVDVKVDVTVFDPEPSTRLLLPDCPPPPANDRNCEDFADGANGSA